MGSIPPTGPDVREYQDDAALLGISVDDEGGILLSASGTGVSAAVGSAITTAIRSGLGGGAR